MFTIFINTQIVRIFAGSGGMITMIVISAYMKERKNESAWIHMASLPVTRKAMNTARFITALLVCALNLLVWLISYNIIVTFARVEPAYITSFTIIGYFWFSMLIHLAMYFFVYYSFNNIVVIAMYFIPMLAISFLHPEGLTVGEYIMDGGYRIIEYGLWCTGLFICSYLVSTYYFTKKNL
jgi:hypothetical protein